MTTESAPHDPDQPLVAGRYELGPVLGVGSSAVVRRGIDLQLDEPVAVKLFHADASMHDRRQQRQEMAALAQLQHPGLIGLHDGGTEAGRPFVVTELVEGPSLAERIEHGPLPADEVRVLGAQLADALAAVHAAGFVHRDLKPANILLEHGHRPRLADFGISRALESTAATTAGCVVGTAAYLSPEQVRGEEVGQPTDVYALGLVLIESLTAQREYPGTPVESATARLHRRPLVPETVPDDVAALLDDMTADDPADRPSAAEVASVLARRPAAELVAELAAEVSPRTAHRSSRRTRHHRRVGGYRRHLGASLVAATVLLLFGLVGTFSLFTDPSGTPATGGTTLVPVQSVMDFDSGSSGTLARRVLDTPVSTEER